MGAVARIDRQGEEGLARQGRGAGGGGLAVPGLAAIVRPDRPDAPVGGEGVDDPVEEELVRVPFARPDVDPVRIAGIEGDRPAREARAGEVCGVEIEAVHEGAPRRAAVVRAEHASAGRGGVQDLSLGGDRQPAHSPADGLVPHRLSFEHDGRPERQPVAAAGDRRGRGRDGGLGAGPGGGGLAPLVLGEPIEPDRAGGLGERGFTRAWPEPAGERDPGGGNGLRPPRGPGRRVPWLESRVGGFDPGEEPAERALFRLVGPDRGTRELHRHERVGSPRRRALLDAPAGWFGAGRAGTRRPLA